MREIASSGLPFQATSFPRVAPVRAEPLWESVAVVVAALMFATNIVEYVVNFGVEGNSPPAQIVYLLTYALFALLLVRSNGLTRIPVQAPLLTVAILMAPISVVWTVNTGETLERSLSLVGSSMFGAYLGWRFTLGRMIFLLAIALAIAAILALLAVFLVPSVGIDRAGPWAGTWRGISFHKNGLGSTSALGCIIIGYALADSRGRTRWLLAVGLMFAAVMLVGSRSTTSLLAALGIGAMAFWARHLQKLPRQIPVLTFIALLTLLIVGIEIAGKELIEDALGLFGKSADLSSRIPIWSLLWTDFIPDRFWLGYGYEAFWTPDTERLEQVERELYFLPYYSHNGLMETWLNGGLVLVLIIATLLASGFAKSAVLMVRWRSFALSSFPLIFCGYFLLINFTESTILGRNSLNWILFVAISVFLAKWTRMTIR